MRMLLLTVLLGGCALGSTYVRPEIALAPAFRGSGIGVGKADSDWWRGFDDQLLVTLVDRAAADNTDIAVARARIDQSRAAARGAQAALLPHGETNTTVTTQHLSRETSIGRIVEALGVGRDTTEFAVGGQASWELNVFGGLRRGREAARAELAASEANAGAVRIAVVAETADAYLTLRALQARLAVAIAQETDQALLLGLVRQRFEQGLAAEREVNRATAELEGVRAAMAPLSAGIEAQLDRLDTLGGQPSGANRARLVVPAPIPAAPAPVGGVPVDLLRRRPDVAAAELRLAASHARVGVAVSEYYPKVSLAGLFGVASLGTANLFTAGAVQGSGGAALRWRLFDFGRVDAEVAGARGREAEALAEWRGSVLRAAEDVETALVRLDEAHRQRASLAAQVAALSRARVQAQDAYSGGVVGLIEVTDADRELLRASDGLADVRAEEARAAVAAYRALGGGWTTAPTPPIAGTER